MRQLVPYRLESGGVVVVEVDIPERPGMEPAGAWDGKLAKMAEKTFEAALEEVRGAAGAVVDKLRTVAIPPDEIGLEFGIKLGLEGKAFIAAAGAEANFKVTMTWKGK